MLEGRLLQIQRDTKAGKSLQALKAVIQKGWPENKSNHRNIISPYLNMRDNMSIQHDLTIKGGTSCGSKCFQELHVMVHSSHLEVNGCLNRARGCVYWARMTVDIKECVNLLGSLRI